MWVFTPFGILMPSLRPPHTVPADDDRLLQVRARRQKDLLILRHEYLPELGEVIEIPYSDYEYRAYCTHEQWAAALTQMSMDIDYVKFKPTTEDKYHDAQLHSVYNRVWGTLFHTVSTPAHRARYMRGAQPSVSTAQVRRSFEREIILGDPFAVADVVPPEWDAEVPTVTRRPDGKIDHSYCEHGSSNAARRRCARRNRHVR